MTLVLPSQQPASQAFTVENRLTMTKEQENQMTGASVMKAGENTAKVGGPTVYESSDLFRGASEIGIEHDGAIYRLKITRQGKLILNK
tara:strand:+ start:7597 stop:7860 length:264 start_codon:yes stop_codon:yes gene_type:complete